MKFSQFSLILILCFLFVATLMLNYGEFGETNNLPNLNPPLAVPVLLNSSTAKHFDKGSEKGCTKVAPLKSQLASRILHDESEQISRAERERDIDKLVLAAESGDAGAAAVVFAAVQTCAAELKLMSAMNISTRRLARADCAKLPPRYIKFPLQLLVPAAEKGSISARLLYAENAPTLNEIYSMRPEMAQLRHEILAAGERYGILAAQDGSMDAYSLLSNAYLTGAFGHVDLPLAYAYADAALRGGDEEASSRLAYIYPKLTKSDFSAATSLVGYCSDTQQRIDVTVNPFKQ